VRSIGRADRPVKLGKGKMRKGKQCAMSAPWRDDWWKGGNRVAFRVNLLIEKGRGKKAQGFESSGIGTVWEWRGKEKLNTLPEMLKIFRRGKQAGGRILRFSPSDRKKRN